MLTHPDVALYLLQHELISAKCIVEGDLIMADTSRRNHNFKVSSKGSPCYLLKQGIGPDGIATVAHEADVYQFLQVDSRNDGLQHYLPRYYGYDPKDHILILELVPDAQDMHEYHARHGRFSTILATAIGNAMSKLHAPTLVEGLSDEDSYRFSGRPHWILSIDRPSLRIFRDVSNANLQLIRIVQQSSEFRQMLDELRQGWRTETLIHHDIKWDNCIVFAGSNSRRKTKLKIVDWEFACLGDPCWDAGSIFSNYLSFWLLSIPITGEEPPERFLELSWYPLERMQPAIRSFWQAYVRGMELDDATSTQWLLRAVKYAGARLIQTAFEQMQMSMQLTGNAVCLLQLSLNIMWRPQEAIVQLLGIPLPERRIP
jgi:thiamine kinase-like enzyme